MVIFEVVKTRPLYNQTSKNLQFITFENKFLIIYKQKDRL